MNTEPYKQQQLALLARKALLNDDLVQIERALSQIGAILQFADANRPSPAESAD